MEVWGAHVPEPARVCAPVYEALDIKANFNKVWRQAGGTGETCQAQTLSLCVQSHPVFTSSGQLAACSVCWTAWQSHIFHHEFYMNINNLKKIHGCHRKTAHTMYVANSTTSIPQYYWTELWQWDGVLEILRLPAMFIQTLWSLLVYECVIIPTIYNFISLPYNTILVPHNLLL